MPSDELLRAEISYAKEILKGICDHFIIKYDDEMSVPEILIELLPEIKKTAQYKNRNFIHEAKRIFLIWQKVLDKPRSNLQPKDLRMIARLFEAGYTEAQIIQGIIGLSKSDYHVDQGYYHIYYVVRSTHQLEIMIHKAEEFGFTEARCQKRLDEYIKDPEKFGLTDSGQINPTTGRTIK